MLETSKRNDGKLIISGFGLDTVITRNTKPGIKGARYNNESFSYL
jgi:hypothetical protein